MLDGAFEFFLIGRNSCRTEDEVFAVQLHHRVVEVGADDEPEVRRQRPRRGGPGQHLHWARVTVDRSEAERNGDCRILAWAGGVVEADLKVRQRRLSTPAVGHYPVGFVDEALVPQLLERPDDRLHIVEVHRLVVVLEIDPAGLTGDRLFPLARVLHDRGATRLVEVLDAVLGNCDAAGNVKLLLGFHLGGKAVAIPTEAAVDLFALHRVIAGDHIFDVPGEEMAMVR